MDTKRTPSRSPLRLVTPPTAEARLWQALSRGRRGWRFRRQARIGAYTVDVLCKEARLIVEIDCAPLKTAAARAEAEERQRDLEAKGYRILRLWADHIESHLGGALRIVDAALEDKRAPAPRRAGRRERVAAPIAA